MVPARRSNGYRGYDEDDVGVVIESGIVLQRYRPGKAGRFVECLCPGHQHSDECPAFLAAYRASIAERDHAIASTHRPPEPSPAEAGPGCWAVHS